MKMKQKETLRNKTRLLFHIEGLSNII